MNNAIFSLFQEVINAARNGRYMFGNGAMWYIVDGFGSKVMINTVEGTKTMVPNYQGTPVTDHATADSLEQFLAQTDASDWNQTTMPYYTARDIVAQAAQKNELLFTNGGQWYINSHGTVIMVELGMMVNENGRQMARVNAASLHAAWKYRRFNGEATRATVDGDTKKYLGIFN